MTAFVMDFYYVKNSEKPKMASLFRDMHMKNLLL